MNYKRVIINTILIFGLGFVVHELYEGTGKNFFVGLFNPVNESIFEHYKLCLTPILFVALVELIIGKYTHNFIFGVAISIVVAQLVTFGGIALYDLLLGEVPMWFHIVIYFVGILSSQLARMKVVNDLRKTYNIVGTIIILINIILIVYFTLNPIHIDYFKDEMTGTYGIFEE